MAEGGRDSEVECCLCSDDLASSDPRQKAWTDGDGGSSMLPRHFLTGSSAGTDSWALDDDDDDLARSIPDGSAAGELLEAAACAPETAVARRLMASRFLCVVAAGFVLAELGSSGADSDGHLCVTAVAAELGACRLVELDCTLVPTPIALALAFASASWVAAGASVEVERRARTDFGFPLACLGAATAVGLALDALAKRGGCGAAEGERGLLLLHRLDAAPAAVRESLNAIAHAGLPVGLLMMGTAGFGVAGLSAFAVEYASRRGYSNTPRCSDASSGYCDDEHSEEEDEDEFFSPHLAATARSITASLAASFPGVPLEFIRRVCDEPAGSAVNEIVAHFEASGIVARSADGAQLYVGKREYFLNSPLVTADSLKAAHHRIASECVSALDNADCPSPWRWYAMRHASTHVLLSHRLATLGRLTLSLCRCEGADAVLLSDALWRHLFLLLERGHCAGVQQCVLKLKLSGIYEPLVLGICQAGTAQYTSAICNIEALLQEQDGDVAAAYAHAQMGITAVILGQFRSALEHFDVVVTRCSAGMPFADLALAHVHGLRSGVLQQLCRTDDALASSTLALTYGAYNAKAAIRAHLQRFDLYDYLGDAASARAELSAASKLATSTCLIADLLCSIAFELAVRTTAKADWRGMRPEVDEARIEAAWLDLSRRLGDDAPPQPSEVIDGLMLAFYWQYLEAQVVLSGELSMEASRSYRLLAETHDAMENHTGMLVFARRALFVSQELFPPMAPERVSALMLMGRALRILGQHELSLQYFEDALKQRTICYGGDDSPEVAAVLSNTAKALSSLHRSLDAYEMRKQESEMTLRMHGPNHMNYARSRFAVGLSLRELGCISEAVSEFERALAIAKRTSSSEHLVVASMCTQISGLMTVVGRPMEGLGYLDQALEIRSRHSVDGICLRVSSVLGKYAVSLRVLGRRDALSFQRRSLEIVRSVHGMLSAAFASEVYYYAALLRAFHRLAQAITCHKIALHIRRMKLEPFHPDIAKSLYRLGSLYFMIESYEDAAASFDQSLEIRKRAESFLRKERSLVVLADTMYRTAVAHLKLGHQDRGTYLLRSAYELFFSEIGPGSREALRCHRALLDYGVVPREQ